MELTAKFEHLLKPLFRRVFLMLKVLLAIEPLNSIVTHYYTHYCYILQQGYVILILSSGSANQNVLQK